MHCEFIFIILLGIYWYLWIWDIFLQIWYSLYSFSPSFPSLWKANVKKCRNFSLYPLYFFNISFLFSISLSLYATFQVIISVQFDSSFILPVAVLTCKVYDIVSFIWRSSMGPFSKVSWEFDCPLSFNHFSNALFYPLLIYETLALNFLNIWFLLTYIHGILVPHFFKCKLIFLGALLRGVLWGLKCFPQERIFIFLFQTTGGCHKSGLTLN